MAWKGDSSNPVPNIGNTNGDISQDIAQQSSNLSEKRIEVNRAYQTRRDNDNQKDNTVTLEDIDTAITRQIEKFQLAVIDEGNKIKVPYYYASPEKWKSIQKDGVIRDYNGKLILPAIVFNRISSVKDDTMRMFNRYLTYPVMRMNSEKNRYTKFGVLMGQNAPINEVYDVVMPDHMVFTYHFIIWTEYVAQMNTLVERFNFEAEDYWGDLRGLRFRTKIEDFQHEIELQVDQDRMVKTEFDLVVNGYLLPDIITKFQGTTDTTRKWFTPKKVVINSETVGNNFDMSMLDNNTEKWKNPNYPNLQKDVVIPSPGVSWAGDISINFLSALKSKINISSGIPVVSSGIIWSQVPPTSNTSGKEGSMAYDSDYLYVFTNSLWKRIPLNFFA